jgi:hypothetical protein
MSTVKIDVPLKELKCAYKRLSIPSITALKIELFPFESVEEVGLGTTALNN